MQGHHFIDSSGDSRGSTYLGRLHINSGPPLHHNNTCLVPASLTITIHRYLVSLLKYMQSSS